MQDIQFAEHKPADVLPDLLVEVEKQLGFAKGPRR